MKPVVFNPVAVDDLEEIVNYISQDNAVAAEDVRCDILDTAEALGDQPDLGVRLRFSASLRRHPLPARSSVSQLPSLLLRTG